MSMRTSFGRRFLPIFPWFSANYAKTVGTALLVFLSVAVMAQYGSNDRRDRDYDRHDRDYDRQGDERGQYDRSSNGASAGGKWMSYRVEDPMTAAKRVRLELPADNVNDRDEQARIILYCTDGKLNLADFHPNVPLSRPNWPGFWGQPQMRVLVRVDDSHSHHNWNWINGHFLAMDKGTVRELIGGHLFRVEFQTPDGPRIAEFSPAGIDRGLASHACGLTPKRP